MTGLPSCPNCPLWHSCPYPALFETPPQPTQLDQQFSQPPNPYVIEPPPLGWRHIRAGELLVFHMVLVGEPSLRQLPLVIHAWQRALRHGLGQARVPAELLRVEYLPPELGMQLTTTTLTVFEAEHVGPSGANNPTTLPAHRAEWPLQEALAQAQHSAPGSAQTIRLHLHTPLRLQNNGRALKPAELNPRTLLSQLLRRCNLMLDLHMGVRPAPFDAPALLASVASTIEDERHALHWQDWRRYSSHQQQDMPLGGVLGTWALHGELAAFLPWLRLGQWLHLGKNATLGMGSFTLEEAEQPAQNPPP